MEDLDGWQRVHAMALAAIEARGCSMEAFYDGAGISETTLRKMADGVPLKRRDKIRSFEVWMGWAPGSAATVADDGEPAPLPDGPPLTPNPSLADDVASLLVELRKAIEEGRDRDTAMRAMTATVRNATDHLAKALTKLDANNRRLERLEELVRSRAAVPPRR